MSNGTKLKIFLGALAIANVVVSLMAAPAHAYQCKGGFTTAANQRRQKMSCLNVSGVV